MPDTLEEANDHGALKSPRSVSRSTAYYRRVNGAAAARKVIEETGATHFEKNHRDGSIMLYQLDPANGRRLSSSVVLIVADDAAARTLHLKLASFPQSAPK